jgi:hypothetical protein
VRTLHESISISAVGVSPCERWIAVATREAQVGLWTVGSARIADASEQLQFGLADLPKGTLPLYVCFAPPTPGSIPLTDWTPTCFVGCLDGTVCSVAASNTRPLSITVQCPSPPVTEVRFAPQKSTLYSGALVAALQAQQIDCMSVSSMGTLCVHPTAAASHLRTPLVPITVIDAWTLSQNAGHKRSEPTNIRGLCVVADGTSQSVLVWICDALWWSALSTLVPSSITRSWFCGAITCTMDSGASDKQLRIVVSAPNQTHIVQLPSTLQRLAISPDALSWVASDCTFVLLSIVVHRSSIILERRLSSSSNTDNHWAIFKCPSTCVFDAAIHLRGLSASVCSTVVRTRSIVVCTLVLAAYLHSAS